MHSMKTLSRTKIIAEAGLRPRRITYRSLTVHALACAGLLGLPSCILQPRAAPETASPAAGAKKKALPAERWQTATTAGGMLGVAADKKGSKGTWNTDDGPK